MSHFKEYWKSSSFTVGIFSIRFFIIFRLSSTVGSFFVDVDAEDDDLSFSSSNRVNFFFGSSVTLTSSSLTLKTAPSLFLFATLLPIFIPNPIFFEVGVGEELCSRLNVECDADDVDVVWFELFVLLLNTCFKSSRLTTGLRCGLGLDMACAGEFSSL